MVVGIGIDSVEIERFSAWRGYSTKKLQRIFTHHEIEYCLSVEAKSAERFAARFAAKEAFYKALCQMNPAMRYLFLKIAPLCEVRATAGAPLVVIPHLTIGLSQELQTLVSITHTRDRASVVVLLQKS